LKNSEHENDALSKLHNRHPLDLVTNITCRRAVKMFISRSLCVCLLPRFRWYRPTHCI